MTRRQRRLRARRDPHETLSARIAEARAARLAAGDDRTTDAVRATRSMMIADSILDAFVVRPRAAPRYRASPSAR